jgi:hypothetical protein
MAQNLDLELKVLKDLDSLGEIEDTYRYVKKDKEALQRLDGVLKSLSADKFVRSRDLSLCISSLDRYYHMG